MATADTDVNMVISDDMPIGEVLKKYPQTMKVFLSHGLMCVGCAIARFENIRQGAQAHGIDVEALIKDLNQVAQQADA
jgi:hybrid cluster-associated redox disulfide protein